MTDPTLHKAAEAYLEHLRTEGKAERTVYTYSKDFEVIEGYLGAETKLSALTPARIGKFLKSDGLLKLADGKPRGERTVQKTVRVLRMCLVWAKATGRIDDLPLPKDLPMGRNAEKEESAANDEKRSRKPASAPAAA